VRLQSGNPLAALQKGVDRSERVANNLLDIKEAFADALLGEFEDGGFGVVQDFVGRV
jgi:hypothetical protein